MLNHYKYHNEQGILTLANNLVIATSVEIVF